MSLNPNLKVTGDDTVSLPSFLADPTEIQTIPAGETVKLNYTISMDSKAADKYQDRSTKFSLKFALEDQVGLPTDDGVDETLRSGTTGTRAPEDDPELTISQPNITDLSDQGLADISWQTDQPAYSWVIYGPVDDGPFQLADHNPDRFGYPLATTVPDEKTTQHSVTLTGLNTDTNYEYRIVAHKSPYVFSPKYYLTIPSRELELPEEVSILPIALADEDRPDDTFDELPPTETAEPEANDQADPDEPTSPKQEPTPTEEQVEDDRSLMAALLGVGGQWNIWLILPLILLLILLIAKLRRKQPNQN